MFPLRDENPTLRPPVATYFLIGLNVVAWLLIQGAGSPQALGESICRFGLIPAELLGRVPDGTLVPLGPGLECTLVGEGSWFSAVSSMFLHGGWFHLIGNMWFLWIFGNNVEDVTGRVRFVLFYLLCGFAADAAQIASNLSSVVPMVGASGAIGGVMGAYAVLFPKTRVQTLLILGFFVRVIELPAVAMLAYWFGLQVLMGLPSIGSQAGGVAFWAHAGGFAAGLALSFVFRDRELMQARDRALVGNRLR